MLMEWRPIPGFDNYSISEQGFVRNDRFDRVVRPMVNQRGAVYVGLWKDDHQFNRAVCSLVAQAFLDMDVDGTFNTPINLNGDKFDNAVRNLAVRPRWFAMKYTRQFQTEQPSDYYPIEDEETKVRYFNPWQAATSCGLIRIEILIAIRNSLEVWPTRQRFVKAYII